MRKQRARKIGIGQRKEIAVLYKNGTSLSEMASRYDVSIGAIRYHLLEAGIYTKKHGHTMFVRCRECDKLINKGWNKLCAKCESDLNKEYKYAKYGLTIEIYNNMINEQNQRCLICKEKTALCVDHDHATGKIRGLLCRKCNAAIGLLGDDIENIKRAIVYLQKTR